jgi:hypothetical protein
MIDEKKLHSETPLKLETHLGAALFIVRLMKLVIGVHRK